MFCVRPKNPEFLKSERGEIQTGLCSDFRHSLYHVKCFSLILGKCYHYGYNRFSYKICFHCSNFLREKKFEIKLTKMHICPCVQLCVTILCQAVLDRNTVCKRNFLRRQEETNKQIQQSIEIATNRSPEQIGLLISDSEEIVTTVPRFRTLD